MTAMTINIKTAQPRLEIIKSLTLAVQSAAGWIIGHANHSASDAVLHTVLCRNNLDVFLDHLIAERLIGGNNAIVQMLRLLQQEGNLTEVNVTCAVHFLKAPMEPVPPASDTLLGAPAT